MEHEQQPWEALDIDDSDLSSLLSPCNNLLLHHQTPLPRYPNSTFTSSQQPVLQRCSLRPLSQTLTSQSQLSKSPSPRLIPGPAGAVQSAMRRRNQHNQTSLDQEEEPIPTQEYIRRVVENGNHDDDEDFASNPWLCGLDFLSREGECFTEEIGTPLNSIKNGIDTERLAQVVAIIKSCTPNGLGDVMVTLKDPTGTMCASIHRKVFTEAEFGKSISVGAVLVLRKVAVFSPSRSAHYLNITLSNVVKVISKDSGPPVKQKWPATSTRCTTPALETSEKSWMLQRTCHPSQQRTDGIMNSPRKTFKLRAGADNDRDIEKENAVPQSVFLGNGNSRNQNAFEERESLLTRLGMGNGITEVASRKNTIHVDQEMVMHQEPTPRRQTEGGNPSCNSQGISNAASLVNIPDDQESNRTSGVAEKRQAVIWRTSLPEWTDEQLDMLMEFD